MNKIEKGELLLKNHKSLKKTLLAIPDSRKMIFDEDRVDRDYDLDSIKIEREFALDFRWINSV